MWPFTNNFPREDIYSMISLDPLHQVIKGTFKDHLMIWVIYYICAKNSESEANCILDELDHQYMINYLISFSYNVNDTGLPLLPIFHTFTTFLKNIVAVLGFLSLVLDSMYIA